MCESDVLLTEFRKTTLLVLYGPFRAVNGRPEKRHHRDFHRGCEMSGPVSPPIKSPARRVSAISSESEHDIATRSLACPFSSAREFHPSPGPKLITGVSPSRDSAFATSP